ncbi:hypothetical protein HDR61_03390 [bacterium]|nr:hypothetical protein [bacterium]
MKIFQKIKNWFAPKYMGQQVGPFYKDDAAILNRLAWDNLIMHASNGKQYWYYFPVDANDVDVVRYLLNRNGIWAQQHNSKYCVDRFGKKRLSFRLKTSYFIDNPDVEKFVRLVSKSYSYDEKMIMEQINGIHAQIKQMQR